MIYDKVLEQCKHIDISKMERDEWLEERRSFIGGSDAGAIMELSNYGSKLTVYLEKKGMAKTEENAAMLRGTIMEPYIRQLTQKKFPCLRIEEAPFIFKSKDNPFIGANVDGFIYVDDEEWEDDYDFRFLVQSGEKLYRGLGVHEIKTSQDGYGFGANEVPDSYYAQVQHYLYVTDLKWGILTVYIIGKNEIRHYPISRNDESIARLVEAESIFWNNHIITNIWPAALGIDSESDMITGMFSGGDTIVFGEAEKALCCEYVELNRQSKDIEKRKDEISTNLKALIVQKAQNGTERKISALAGNYSMSWSRFETSRIDNEALKKAGLYEQFLKKSETGRFTITEKKGA